jgi:N utilization substance protein B
MGSRRKSREQALQILYQVDGVDASIDQALDVFWDTEPADPDVVEFARILVRGVHKHKDQLDELIGAASINWKVVRMSYVDRNLLRVAVFEFLHMDDVPAMVSINEAIELGKRFGSNDSAAFINGILDKVARTLGMTEEQGA